MSILADLWRDDTGRNLFEYTVVMAFVALALVDLFIRAGATISSIWGSV